MLQTILSWLYIIAGNSIILSQNWFKEKKLQKTPNTSEYSVEKNNLQYGFLSPPFDFPTSTNPVMLEVHLQPGTYPLLNHPISSPGNHQILIRWPQGELSGGGGEEGPGLSSRDPTIQGYLGDLKTDKTLWWTNKKLLKMAIEIVDFPIKHGDFPLLWDSSLEGTHKSIQESSDGRDGKQILSEVPATS